MSDTQNGRLAHTGVNEITLTVADFSPARATPSSCSDLRKYIAELKNIAVLVYGTQVMQNAKAMGDADSTVRRSVNARYTLPAATTLHFAKCKTVVFEGLLQATAMARIGGLVLGHQSTGQVAV